MNTDRSDRIPEFTIGDRLRKAREKTGLGQAAFARKIGVSRGTVSTYENEGTADYKRPFLVSWALATDVPLEWLETGTAHPKPPNGSSMVTGAYPHIMPRIEAA